MLSMISGNGWALLGAALAVILAGCGSAYGVGVAGSDHAASAGYSGYLWSAGCIHHSFQGWSFRRRRC